ncbi:hypothetical protein DM860_007437 [Cuscuta australis]|uniref:Uncharacterized protein n=1 Tax=Cuscuta australis TaxID=267555 RepID=A0A328E7T5_9ASTE|nr:hypothetical protein DM860_007437 [Cuscuta australis]
MNKEERWRPLYRKRRAERSEVASSGCAASGGAMMTHWQVKRRVCSRLIATFLGLESVGRRESKRAWRVATHVSRGQLEMLKNPSKALLVKGNNPPHKARRQLKDETSHLAPHQQHAPTVSPNLFKSMLDRMNQRLEGWKSKDLSFAGRQKPKAGASNVWRGLVKAKQVLQRAISMQIGNGQKTLFWHDRWIDQTSLKDQVPLDRQVHINEGKVASMWIPGVGWNWERIGDLPDDLKNKLTCCYITDDECYWQPSATGKFSVSSAYELTNIDGLDMQDTGWVKIWKLKIPNRIRAFLWLARHERLACNAERYRRHLAEADTCPSCVDKSESVEHIIRDCPNIKRIWNKLLGTSIVQGLSNHNFRQWMDDQVAGKSIIDNSQEEECMIQVRWQKPDNDTFCLNVDGSVDGTGAGCGGVLRGHDGNWIGGFMCSCNTKHPTVAEAWAVLQGLKWAWKKGLRKLIVQCDSLECVEWIHGRHTTRGPAREVIEACQSWMGRDWNVTICHILRGQNKVADLLARMGKNRALIWRELEFPPNGARQLLEEDKLGYYTVRNLS